MSLLPDKPPRASFWAETRWSVVRGLAREEAGARERAWTELVETYRDPMEGFVLALLRRTGAPCAQPAVAADIVQGFLLGCVEKGWLQEAAQEQGSFRAYVRTILRRLVMHHVRDGRALKRHPGQGRRLLQLETGADDALASADDVLQDFDRAWVAAAVERALAMLGAKDPRSAEIVRDLIAGQGEPSPDLAERMGIEPKYLAVLRHRARKRFADCFQLSVRATARNAKSFEREWLALAPYLP
jgi:DNA-directed RNA polymerase specialized sigma24 family protein